MDVTPYWNEDKTKYAVLVSRGFGAGFSTWNDNYPEIAYDNRVIEWFLAHDDDYFKKLRSFASNKETKEAHEFFKSLGYNDVCMLGLEKCEIEWVSCGVIWRMYEYDGAERIEYQNNSEWICFN